VGIWRIERELKHAAKEGEIIILPRLYNQSKGKRCYTVPSKQSRFKCVVSFN
jgi:hypothetical protein